MMVTDVASVDKKSVRVFIDGSFAFRVYQKDFYKYPLLEAFQQGQEISDQELSEVYEKLLLPRAKEAALCLLERSDRSEWEIRRKLKEKEYPEAIYDAVISYLHEYHYLDEDRLIRSYLAGNAHTKSRRMILQKLKQRGLSEENVCRIMEEEGCDSEKAATYALRKKLAGRTESDLNWNEKQKINAYLYRKGYTSDEIYAAWKEILISE